MIVVSGESLMDMMPVEPGSVETAFRPRPGGSPFNVAMALGRLEVPSRFLCRLSQDAFGRRLAKTLEDSAVDLSHCPRNDQPTMLGFVTLDETGQKPEYLFYTDGTAGVSLQESDLEDAMTRDAVCLHFGSLSLAVEPMATTLEALLNRRQNGQVISLDPNVRPALVSDRSAYLKRLDRFFDAAHLVKLSDEDLSWLNPDTDLKTFAAELLQRGVHTVVTTRGEGGASAFTSSGEVSVEVEPREVADTVGAGDSFQAGLLAWLHANEFLSPEGLKRLEPSDWEHALRFAAEVAGVNCERQGCNPPRRHELKQSIRRQT